MIAFEHLLELCIIDWILCSPKSVCWNPHYRSGGIWSWGLHIVVYMVRSLSRILLFVTPWTAACQAPLSSTISWSLLKFVSTELVMVSISTSVIPFSSCLQSFPALRSSPVSQFFKSGGLEVIKFHWRPKGEALKQ